MRKVHPYHYRQLPELFKWQILAFMKVEWPFIFSGPYQFTEDTYPPEQDPVHFIIAEGNALLSHAEIINMNLEHAGTAYRVYGLGNVFTFPPYRGNGFGLEVVKAATNYIHNSEVDAAILFCDPKMNTFYETAGWEGLPGASTRIGTPEKSEENDGLRMMLFLSEKGRDGYPSFLEQPLYIDDPW
ncbi:MAG: GNAT family N-acetyltransferase [Anaerolineales bacterium]|nr:GNAT family N-acetyltransferase [Anaerolineales bacterium]